MHVHTKVVSKSYSNSLNLKLKQTLKFAKNEKLSIFF